MSSTDQNNDEMAQLRALDLSLASKVEALNARNSDTPAVKNT